MTTEAERDCKHGQLARSCNVCELEAEVERQAAEIERLHDYDTRLTAVMPADFKDWHENSRNEWPELAAWVITNLREREAEANAEIERLRATSPDKREDLRCVIADLMRQCQESDALLRQALVLLRGPAPNGYGVGSEQEAVIDAIKTHLGEV